MQLKAQRQFPCATAACCLLDWTRIGSDGEVVASMGLLQSAAASGGGIPVVEMRGANGGVLEKGAQLENETGGLSSSPLVVKPAAQVGASWTTKTTSIMNESRPF